MKLYWYIYNNCGFFRYVRNFYLYVLKIDWKFQIIALLLIVILSIIAKLKYKRRLLGLTQAIAYVVLPVYVFLLFASLVFSRPNTLEININLSPFWTEKAILLGKIKYLKSLIYNLLMLVPWGLLFPVVRKTSFVKTILGGFLISFLIELLQLMTKTGLCELDDLIHNTIGVTWGYGIFYMLKLYCNKRVLKVK